MDLPSLEQVLTQFLVEEIPEIERIDTESLANFDAVIYRAIIRDASIYVGYVRAGHYKMNYRSPQYPNIDMPLANPNSLPIIVAHVRTCLEIYASEVH